MDSLTGLNEVKTEIDDDMEGDGLFEPSVLDRVLASTHRQQSTSPALENDDSGPQSVGTSGVGEEDRTEIAMMNEGTLKEEREQRNEKTDHLTRVLQSLQANSNFSIKNQILSRQQQVQQIMNKQILQAGKTAFDWMNDEDMLYSRIIGLRLQKMDPKRRKRVRAQIMCLLEGSDLDDDDSLSPRSPRLEPIENNIESRTDGNSTTAPCSSPALGYPVCL